jgi:hypothetical protein
MVMIISCVVIGLFAVILALMKIGRRMVRRRKSQDPTGATAGLSAIDGAVWGFMGLLIPLLSREQPPVSMREDSELVRKQTLSGRRIFGLTCCRRQNDHWCETTSAITFYLDSDRYRRSCLDGRPQRHEAIAGGECKPVIAQTRAEWFLGNYPVRCGETRRARRIRGG